MLRCHAVLLARAHKARALARLLRQTALAAFSDFKRLQRQSDARHVRQQHLRAGGAAASVPRAPLRWLLNAKCAYRPPPAERGRGAPRLSSIQEEDEEEVADAEERERPEVLSLARELRTCSLRGAPAQPPPAQPRRWKAGSRERAGQAR